MPKAVEARLGFQFIRYLNFNSNVVHIFHSLVMKELGLRKKKSSYFNGNTTGFCIHDTVSL